MWMIKSADKKHRCHQSAHEGEYYTGLLSLCRQLNTMRVHDEPLKPIDDDSEAERTNNLMSSAMMPKLTRSIGPVTF